MSKLVVDREALLEYLGDDTSLLQEVIGIFMTDCPGKLAAIQSAATARVPNEIMNAAHALKGSVSVFGAKDAVAAVQTLELMGRQGNLEGLKEALSVLEREMVLLTSALDEIAKASV